MSKYLLRSKFSLLHLGHVKLGREWNHSNVISPFYRLYFIDGGEGRLSDSTTEEVIEEGYLYLIPPYTLCQYKCDKFLDQFYLHFIEDYPFGESLFAACKKIFKIKAISRDKENFLRLLQLNPRRNLGRKINPIEYENEKTTQNALELNTVQAVSVQMETQGIILQMLSRFLSCNSFVPSKVQMPPVIANAMNYIHTHLDEPVKVSMLAGMANLNADYFSRLFRHHTGWQVLHYLQHKRIEKAQHLILTTTLSFEDISLAAGFDEIAYFSKIFKKITGTTPGQYRKQIQTI